MNQDVETRRFQEVIPINDYTALIKAELFTFSEMFSVGIRLAIRFAIIPYVSFLSYDMFGILQNVFAPHRCGCVSLCSLQ